MKRLSFRGRVLLSLVLFALVPSAFLMLSGVALVGTGLPVLASSEAWDSVAASGRVAIAAAREADLTSEQRVALARHEAELESSVTQARRLRFLASRAGSAVIVFSILGLALVAFVSTRVAGHFSRQLGRPLTELVGWTELIAKGRPLPEQAVGRGAPEFEVLRRRMRKLARELESAREVELEGERLRAFRETARQVAHELKNPLTPIRFAVERLRREAPPSLGEVVEVLATESARLEEMAKSFAQFGRLPEGPVSDVDLAELARYTARATVPDDIPVRVDVDDGVPMIAGHHDALSRALTNVLLNAVDASRDGGSIAIGVSRATLDGVPAVSLSVRDTGRGIEPELLSRIWEPYVTSKSGGTGLGLAIARQTVIAHGGRVSATSRAGEGAEIRFIFPVRAPSGAIALPEPAASELVGARGAGDDEHASG